MSDDDWMVLIVAIVIFLAGAAVGAYVSSEAAAHPFQKVDHMISYGCIDENATELQGSINNGFSNTPEYQFTVSGRAPFSTEQGTFPNGTAWEILTVTC
jgi:hypothetical protein